MAEGELNIFGQASLTVLYKGNPKPNLYEMVIDRFSQTFIVKADIYQPSPVQRVYILKGKHGKRPLGIPIKNNRVHVFSHMFFPCYITSSAIPI